MRAAAPLAKKMTKKMRRLGRTRDSSVECLPREQVAWSGLHERRVLTDQRATLDALSERLLDKEVVEGEELRAMLAPAETADV